MRAVYIYKHLRTTVLVLCFILMLYMTSDMVTMRHAQVYYNESSSGAQVVQNTNTIKTNLSSIESKLKQYVKINDNKKSIKLKHMRNKTNKPLSSSTIVRVQEICKKDDTNLGRYMLFCLVCMFYESTLGRFVMYYMYATSNIFIFSIFQIIILLLNVYAV